MDRSDSTGNTTPECDYCGCEMVEVAIKWKGWHFCSYDCFEIFKADREPE